MGLRLGMLIPEAYLTMLRLPPQETLRQRGGTDWAASHEQINIVNKVRTMIQNHTPQRMSLSEGSPSTLVHAAGLPSGSPAASITKIASNGSN